MCFETVIPQACLPSFKSTPAICSKAESEDAANDPKPRAPVGSLPVQFARSVLSRIHPPSEDGASMLV